MIVYLSGPMSGKPEMNFPAFHAAAKLLRERGHQVVNPAEIEMPANAKWEDCMRADIAQLVTCQAIYLLPGWRESRGATLEARIAKGLGMEVLKPSRESPERERDAKRLSARDQIVGQRYGRLQVVRVCERKAYVECRCDCGQQPMIDYRNLKRGATASCGCLRSETTRQRHTVHGYAARGTDGKCHGVYTYWRSVRSRCYDPRHRDYVRYGATGVRMCARWREDFTAFYADMGDPPARGMSLHLREGATEYGPQTAYWGPRNPPGRKGEGAAP